MVFDDLLLEKQSTCASYCVRGRHSNVDCFYLAQTISSNRFKQSERMRISFVVSQDLKNPNHIYDNHVGSDMTKEEFRQLCKTAWTKQHGFVIIDLNSKNTIVSIEVGLTSFTYKIKLIFSLKNGESS